MKAVLPVSPRSRRSRRGAALIIAIVCAGLCALMLGTMLKITMTRTRQIRHQERTRQSDWLAEAGLERARAILLTRPDYIGETWTVDAKSLSGPYSGVVTITVDAANENAQTRTVHVRADYPAEPALRVRRTKQVEMTIKPRPSADAEDAS